MTEYKLYTSTVNGFSINYPSNWRCETDSGFFLVGFFPNTKGTVPTNIHIIIPDLSIFQESPTPEQFIEISKSQIEQQGAKNIKVVEARYGQYQGHAFTYLIPSGEGDIKFKQFLFIQGAVVYVISYSSPASEYDEYLKNYEEVVPTLKIFKAKGYKYIQLAAKTYQIKEETLFLQTWYPKSWKSIVSNANQQHYRDDSNDLHYHVHVEEQKDISLEQFNSTTMKERLDKVTTESYQIKPFTLLNHDSAIVGSQVELESTELQPITRFTHIVWFLYENHIFTVTFKTPEGDGKIYANIFQRLLARLRVQNFALDSPPYDIFDNFTSKYYLSIPKTFSLIPKMGGVPSLIFEDSSMPGLPVFVITCEELGKPVLLDEYQQLIIYFHMKGLEGNSQLISTTESHIDKYRATQCIMKGIDPELQTNCKLMFKCAVIKRSKGFLLNIRVPYQMFEDFHDKVFYLFDSVSFY